MTLVLCLPDGCVVGALPPLAVSSPWWSDVGELGPAVRATHGLDVTVLRLLAAPPGPTPAGGAVTYLAEVPALPARQLGPWPAEPTAAQPLRQPWACPGGPAAALTWADAVLAERGTGQSGPAEQVKTWNLSGVWRLHTSAGPVWLKCVPDFFGHEGAVIARLDPLVVPTLLAVGSGRLLMGNVAGTDRFGAPLEQLLRMVGLLVDLQHAWSGRVEELLALGLPDWRPGAIAALAADTLRRTADQLDATTVGEVAALIAGLPGRFAAVAECGLPDTLVHGDFHPGNVRGTGDALTLMDWGDCGVGHPILDQAAFLERLSADDREAVQAEWDRLWWARRPGSDGRRASALLAPVAALRQATIYRKFLDRIEPDEHVYHQADPAFWLGRAAALARQLPG